MLEIIYWVLSGGFLFVAIWLSVYIVMEIIKEIRK